MTPDEDTADLPELDPPYITWEWTQNASEDQWQARRKLGAARLAQRYSSIPSYRARAAQDPAFWLKFYDSRPNS